MKRNLLLKLLEEYTNLYEEEISVKQAIIAFVKKEERCFERSLQIGHITGSAWLLNKEKSHVLLMHHAKLDIWCQLGGHADGESDVLAVALKEAQEESGIQSIIPVSYKIFDLDVHKIPATDKDPEHFHYDIRFILQVASAEEPVLNNEAKSLKWFHKEEKNLPTKERSILRMMEKWRKIF